MRVLVITSEFHPTMGGWARYTKCLTEELAKRGHKITIISPYQKMKKEIYHNKNIRILRILPSLKFSFLGDAIEFILNFPKIVLTIQRLKGFEIIHATSMYMSGIYGWLLKKIFNKPLIITVHGSYSIVPLKHKVGKLLLKQCYFFSDKIIAVSNFTKNEIEKRINYNLPNLTVIPNGVEVERFNPEVDPRYVRDKLNLGNSPIILTVGRLVERKGIKITLCSFKHVLKEIPNAVYIIVGSGSKSQLMELCNKLEITESVYFTDFVQDSELPYYYAACDLFILTPKKIGDLFEGFGLVYLEANATGKPIIGTRSGGVPEVIKDEYNGFLREIKDIRGIAEKIILLLKDKRLRRKIGRNGLKLVHKRFTWSHVSEKVEKVYETCLNN